MSFVVDPETGEVFSLVFVKAHLRRDCLKQNKPAMKSGCVQLSFCNPNTGKCIYRENHSDKANVFSSGTVVDSRGDPVKSIRGVAHISPALVNAGDTVEMRKAKSKPVDVPA